MTTGALATITVTPNPVTAADSGTQQFTAVGRDADGNVVPITPDLVGGGRRRDDRRQHGLFTAGDVPGTYTNTVAGHQRRASRARRR